MQHAVDNGTCKHRFQVLVQWANTDEWQWVSCHYSRFFAVDKAMNVSTSGGRVKRVEVRERGASAGEALFDMSWS